MTNWLCHVDEGRASQLATHHAATGGRTNDENTTAGAGLVALPVHSKHVTIIRSPKSLLQLPSVVAKPFKNQKGSS
jgi:hypothetical protein